MRAARPPVAVSAVSSWAWSLNEDLAFWREAEIGDVGLSLRKLEDTGFVPGAARIRDAGLRVSSIGEVGWFVLSEPASWPAQRERLLAAVEAAATVSAGCIVVTTGPAGPLDWDDAAAAFGAALAPVAAACREAGVACAVENTSSLRLDLSFVTTLVDALDLARVNDISVCVELNSCWAERDVHETLRGNVDALALIQVSDFVVGTLSTPDRAVPGDGDIPLADLLHAAVAAGYERPLEIELVGPRIEAEGYGSVIRRSRAHIEAILDDLFESG
jgi:sugar phosphate isomerase/epimerase